MDTKILSYDDVRGISLGSNDEPLVSVQLLDNTIIIKYDKFDMVPYTGLDMMVRQSVAERLAQVNKYLYKNFRLRLQVVYGYRAPVLQQKYFKARYESLKATCINLNDDELIRMTHEFVAVPDSAGHTLGAAVDLTLIDAKDSELNMGGRIADYSDPESIKTFSKSITKTQLKNRTILLEAMMVAGFAPFLGEW